MQLILTEHHEQQLNYEHMLKGTRIQSVTSWIDLIYNPQVIPDCQGILVAYLPKDLFYLPVKVLQKPLIKDNSKTYLSMPNKINFKIKDKYLNSCRELYHIIMKYKPTVLLATDDTLHGEFLGLYFMKKYHLENVVKKRLVSMSQTASSLRFAYGHPRSLLYHINYATAYYYRMFQKRLIYVNLTRMYTLIMHKKKFPYLFPTYLSQYLVLSKIKKSTKALKQNNNNWEIRYLDAYSTTFRMKQNISGKKQKIRNLTVNLQKHPLIITQAPKKRIYNVQPPRMLTTMEIIKLIQQRMHISSQDIVEKGLKPAYWKYHIISYPYTDNHLITMSQFNILKTVLGAYYHQMNKILPHILPRSIFKDYDPKARFVYKSKIKAMKNYQTALIPVRIVDMDEYKKFPKLIQLILKLVIMHVLLMFAKPARVKEIQINAQSQGNKFQSKNVKILEPNWLKVVSSKIKEHQVNLKNYEVGHHIQGRFTSVPKETRIHNKISDFVKNKKNIKTLYDKTFERYYNLQDLYRHHLIAIHDKRISLTVNGYAELSMMNKLHVKKSLMKQPILYNDYSKVTNHLRQPHKQATEIGATLVKKTKQYLLRIWNAMLTQNIELPETPPAPQKDYIKQETLPINCPRCHKSYLLYQKYHIIKHSKIHERYYCPHCKLYLPTHKYSFPIHSSVLPFIFQGMFPPSIFKVGKQFVRGKLIYKDGHILLKK